MKKLLSVGLLTLFLGMTAIPGSALPRSRDRDANEGIQHRFIGAWRLVWLEEPGTDGKIQKVDCTGLLVFTRDGHMSVQVMYRNPGARSGAPPVQYARGGYEASFGTYVIDEHAHSLSFHVDGALVRTLISKDLPRVYEFSDKQLIVNSSDPNEHWKVAWEHY